MKILTSVMIAMLFLQFMNGCEGEAGIPGVNKLPSDLYPPSVELVQPFTQTKVYENLVLEAYAHDDNEIEAVEFLIDGKGLDNDSLTFTEPPWQILWNCNHLELGIHTIQARTWDDQGKSGLSQLAFIEKVPADQMITEDTLRFYDVGGDDYEWIIPDTLFTFTGIGVRFTPLEDCKIAKIGIYIGTTFGSSDTARFNLEVWNSEKGDPVELVWEKRIDIRVGPGDHAWYWPSISNWDRWVAEEFYIMLDFSETAPTDTFLVYTDDGIWRNHHGVTLENGEISGFTFGGLHFNPLLYANIRY